MQPDRNVLQPLPLRHPHRGTGRTSTNRLDIGPPALPVAGRGQTPRHRTASIDVGLIAIKNTARVPYTCRCICATVEPSFQDVFLFERCDESSPSANSDCPPDRPSVIRGLLSCQVCFRATIEMCCPVRVRVRVGSDR
jgi:hypothetical protein